MSEKSQRGRQARVDVRFIAEELSALYKCGLTAEEIIGWMTVADSDGRRVLDRTIHVASEDPVKSVRKKFCGDCYPPYRRAMAAAGRCIRDSMNEADELDEADPAAEAVSR